MLRKGSTVLASLLEQGKLKLVGMVFELESGRARMVDV